MRKLPDRIYTFKEYMYTQESNQKRIVSTIEARMTSTRLPGKVLLPVCGKPMLAHLIERLQRVPRLDAIVVATTVNKEDDPIVELAQKIGVGYFRGSEEDVLGRVLDAAQACSADIIVEITGDCPAIDPHVVARCIDVYLTTEADYVTSGNKTYPGGMNTRVFSTKILAEVELISRNDKAAREHVSLPIYEHPERYKLHTVEAPPGLSRPDLAIELDEPADYEMIKAIFEALYPGNPEFGLADILSFLDLHPEVVKLNEHVGRKTAR